MLLPKHRWPARATKAQPCRQCPQWHHSCRPVQPTDARAARAAAWKQPSFRCYRAACARQRGNLPAAGPHLVCT